METKWKLISVLLVGLLCFGLFFLIKGSMALDTSDATTEQIKKASMSQTPVANKKQEEKVHAGTHAYQLLYHCDACAKYPKHNNVLIRNRNDFIT